MIRGTIYEGIKHLTPKSEEEINRSREEAMKDMSPLLQEVLRKALKKYNITDIWDETAGFSFVPFYDIDVFETPNRYKRSRAELLQVKYRSYKHGQNFNVYIKSYEDLEKIIRKIDAEKGIIKRKVSESIKHLTPKSEHEMGFPLTVTTTVDDLFTWMYRTPYWYDDMVMDWIWVEDMKTLGEPFSEKQKVKDFLRNNKNEKITIHQSYDRDFWDIIFTIKGRKAKVLTGAPYILKTKTNESKINEEYMKKLFEEEQVYSEAHAKELLNAQVQYNKALQDLNNKLAKQKSDLAVKHMKLAQAAAQAKNQPQAQQPKQPQPQQTQQKQTGTVSTTGQPVNAQGNPPSNESIDILRIKNINEDELDDRMKSDTRFGRLDWQRPGTQGMSNWYQRQGGKEHDEKSPRPKRMDWKREKRIQELEDEIEQYEYEIKSIMSNYEAPTHEGAEGEVENFFGEIGSEAAEILNSGAYRNSQERLKALKDIGIEDAQAVLQTYYEYFPEWNPKKEKERIAAEKEAAKIQEKIDKIQAKIDKWWKVYESLNESLSTYNTESADETELKSLKDYMNAEGIEYTEDAGTIEFDDEQLDIEWKELIERMGLTPIEISAEVDAEEGVRERDEIENLNVEDDDIDIVDVDNDIDEEKVFYVKVSEDGKEFTGKVYKLFDDGDWRAKVTDGESETFEQLNYDPEFDEFDIVSFLRDNYDSAELIPQSEFEERIEEGVTTVMDKTEKMKNQVASMATGGVLGGQKGDPGYVENLSAADLIKKDEEPEEEEVQEEPVTEKLHLQTLEEFMNESLNL